MATIHFDKVRRQHSQPGRVYFLAIYFHSPFFDEAVCCAAGFIAAGSQEFIESHASLRCGRVGILISHML